MTIDIEQPDSNSTMLNIDNPKMTLTFVDSTEEKNYNMYLFKDIVNERKTIKTDMGEFNSQEVYDEILHRMRQWIPDLDIS